MDYLSSYAATLLEQSRLYGRGGLGLGVGIGGGYTTTAPAASRPSPSPSATTTTTTTMDAAAAAAATHLLMAPPSAAAASRSTYLAAAELCLMHRDIARRQRDGSRGVGVSEGSRPLDLSVKTGCQTPDSTAAEDGRSGGGGGGGGGLLAVMGNGAEDVSSAATANGFYSAGHGLPLPVATSASAAAASSSSSSLSRGSTLPSSLPYSSPFFSSQTALEMSSSGTSAAAAAYRVTNGSMTDHQARATFVHPSIVYGTGLCATAANPPPPSSSSSSLPTSRSGVVVPAEPSTATSQQRRPSTAAAAAASLSSSSSSVHPATDYASTTGRRPALYSPLEYERQLSKLMAAPSLASSPSSHCNGGAGGDGEVEAAARQRLQQQSSNSTSSGSSSSNRTTHDHVVMPSALAPFHPFYHHHHQQQDHHHHHNHNHQHQHHHHHQKQAKDAAATALMSSTASSSSAAQPTVSHCSCCLPHPFSLSCAWCVASSAAATYGLPTPTQSLYAYYHPLRLSQMMAAVAAASQQQQQQQQQTPLMTSPPTSTLLMASPTSLVSAPMGTTVATADRPSSATSAAKRPRTTIIKSSQSTSSWSKASEHHRSTCSPSKASRGGSRPSRPSLDTDDNARFQSSRWATTTTTTESSSSSSTTSSGGRPDDEPSKKPCSSGKSSRVFAPVARVPPSPTHKTQQPPMMTASVAQNKTCSMDVLAGRPGLDMAELCYRRAVQQDNARRSSSASSRNGDHPQPQLRQDTAMTSSTGESAEQTNRKLRQLQAIVPPMVSFPVSPATAAAAAAAAAHWTLASLKPEVAAGSAISVPPPTSSSSPPPPSSSTFLPAPLPLPPRWDSRDGIVSDFAKIWDTRIGGGGSAASSSSSSAAVALVPLKKDVEQLPSSPAEGLSPNVAEVSPASTVPPNAAAAATIENDGSAGKMADGATAAPWTSMEPQLEIMDATTTTKRKIIGTDPQQLPVDDTAAAIVASGSSLHQVPRERRCSRPSKRKSPVSFVMSPEAKEDATSVTSSVTLSQASHKLWSPTADYKRPRPDLTSPPPTTTTTPLPPVAAEGGSAALSDSLLKCSGIVQGTTDGVQIKREDAAAGKSTQTAVELTPEVSHGTPSSSSSSSSTSSSSISISRDCRAVSSSDSNSDSSATQRRRPSVNATTPDGFDEIETVLHRAARLGQLDDVAIEHLERIGGNDAASIDATDGRGYTALHRSCACGHLEVARVLLQCGADCEATVRRSGRRPIHEAVAGDHVEVVRLLLSYGADPLASCSDGDTQQQTATPSKLATSKVMQVFLKGHLADVNGEMDESTGLLPWQFQGSASFLDPVPCGYNIFEDMPSEDDEDEDVNVGSILTAGKLTGNIRVDLSRPSIGITTATVTAAAHKMAHESRPSLPPSGYVPLVADGSKVVERTPPTKDTPNVRGLSSQTGALVFEVSDKPHITTYRVPASNTGKGSSGRNNSIVVCHLTDVLRHTGMDRDAFLACYPNIRVTTMPRTEFVRKAASRQMYVEMDVRTSTDVRFTSASQHVIELLQWNDMLRDILDIEIDTVPF